MAESMFRRNETDEGSMLIVNARNSSDIIGSCFVLGVGSGGVKTICEYRQSASWGNQNQSATNFAQELWARDHERDRNLCKTREREVDERGR